ncbi:dynamin family protein [Actinomycetospora termitidis]|uniref:Dynamin family protein n=1 Tax=Actinomycetospora termitidis TaxID=3053470 RepID=A0ABT7ME50_9PSEU|nr:dynamin family protein [Actinomycetospora sp. Odt1-22]MDL5158943.1 dynamin family protein [Actinomycetospora sp. Odt1-22]
MTIEIDLATARAPHAVTPEVLALVADVRAAAAEDGENGLVENLDRELAHVRAGAARIVVVGEKKRGKSSLINAVIGRPGLLPVDADVATSVHVVLRHGPVPGAVVVDEQSPGGREVGLSELSRYVGAEQQGVSEVSVTLPEVPDGLELVDTPGVGGLVAGHAELTLATLERADALLFVLDGQSEITASELTFLERASERIATVLIAVTKIDRFVEWRTIVTRDLARVAEHAPRYSSAAWFPVSAKLSDAAARAAADRPDVATRRREASGMDPLVTRLRQAAVDAEGLRLANLVHRVDLTVRRLCRTQVRRSMSLTPDPGFAARVKVEREALTALQSRTASWRQTLADRSARIDQGLRTEFARRVEDLRKQCHDRIAAGGGTVLAEISADLPARVQAVWVDLDTQLRKELPGLVEAVADTIDTSGIQVLDGGPRAAPGRLAEDELPEAARGAASISFVEQTVMSMGLGSMTMGLLSLLVAAPVGLAAGAAVVGIFAYRRHQRDKILRDREDARRHVAEVTARMTTEIPPALSAAVARAREAVSAEVARAIVEEKERLNARLAEHQKAQAAEESDVANRKKASDATLRKRSQMRERASRLAEILACRDQDGGTGS